METFCRNRAKKTALLFILLAFPAVVFAQDSIARPRNDFWQRTQIGGGIGLSVGSGYTDILVAPSGIYNFNQYVAAGIGLQGSYVRAKNAYESYIYGGSLIGLFAPVEQVQVSVELEELRVNTRYSANIYTDPYYADNDFEGDFWNTALYVGAGYRVENVTIGVRYNLLYDRNKSVYSEPFMPFIRAYF